MFFPKKKNLFIQLIPFFPLQQPLLFLYLKPPKYQTLQIIILHTFTGKKKKKREEKKMGSNKPYIVAVFIQITFAGMSLMSKAAFAAGMNTYIFLFYRQAAGSIILVPLTLILKGYVLFLSKRLFKLSI